MFKVHRDFTPPYFSAVLCVDTNVHSHNTRHASDYHTAVHWTSLLNHIISIVGPLLLC